MRNALFLVLLIALAGCGRKDSPTHLQLESRPFDGDSTAWRLHEKERAQHQTEYGAR
jgi:hypothetical protein